MLEELCLPLLRLSWQGLAARLLRNERWPGGAVPTPPLCEVVWDMTVDCHQGTCLGLKKSTVCISSTI